MIYEAEDVSDKSIRHKIEVKHFHVSCIYATFATT